MDISTLSINQLYLEGNKYYEQEKYKQALEYYNQIINKNIIIEDVLEKLTNIYYYFNNLNHATHYVDILISKFNKEKYFLLKYKILKKTNNLEQLNNYLTNLVNIYNTNSTYLLKYIKNKINTSIDCDFELALLNGYYKKTNDYHNYHKLNNLYKLKYNNEIIYDNTISKKILIYFINLNQDHININFEIIKKYNNKHNVQILVENNIDNNIIKNYDYVLIINNVLLSQNFNFNDLISIYEYLELDVIAPSYTNNSLINNKIMKQENYFIGEEVRLTNYCDYNCYLVSSNKYNQKHSKIAITNHITVFNQNLNDKNNNQINLKHYSFYKNISNNNFDVSMIVYTKSEKRLNNFNEIKKIIPQMKMFDAIDTINNFDHYIKLSKDKNMLTDYFLEYCGNYKGKLGCMLSHLFLLDDFLNNSDSDWLLIFEDDIGLNNYTNEEITRLINIAINNNSDYIQLYTHPKFISDQMKQEQVDNNLFKMIKQWGALAFIINKKVAKYILSKLPFNDNLDVIYSEYITHFNSLCYINDIFINKGAVDQLDKSSEFGSLLWDK